MPSKLHPDVIEAAHDLGNEMILDDAEARARRVLAAQAKPAAISTEACAALMTVVLNLSGVCLTERTCRAALSFALLHLAKDGE